MGEFVVSFLSPFDLMLLSSLHVHYIPIFLACVTSLVPCIVSFVFRFFPYICIYDNNNSSAHGHGQNAFPAPSLSEDEAD